MSLSFRGLRCGLVSLGLIQLPVFATRRRPIRSGPVRQSRFASQAILHRQLSSHPRCPARSRFQHLDLPMFTSKVFWAIVLGIITSVLLLEAKINLAFSALRARALQMLAVPGAHFVTAITSRAGLETSGTRFWGAVAFACNLLCYFVFWYACIWLAGYLRARRHPYDRQSTLIQPVRR